jgi:hypothetical protein
LEVTARDLSRFASLARTALKGEARLTAEPDGAPRYGELNATLDARATKLVTGYAPRQGHRRRSQGDRRGADDDGGGFGFTDLVVEGARLAPQRRLRQRQSTSTRGSTCRRSAVDPRMSAGQQSSPLTGTPDDLGASPRRR